MKGPAQLTADITRRLKRTWAQDITSEALDQPPSESDPAAQAGWPHAFPLGRASSAELAAGFGDYLTELTHLREWAQQYGVTLTWDERRVAGTPQRIPTHATVTSIEAAAATAGGDWLALLARARSRARALTDRYPHAATPQTLAAVTRLTDLDFDLLCRAADWFTIRSGVGLTPRQVPVEGLHAKWLNSRHQLVARLAGRDSLELLPPHPARIHFTYLDPGHRTRGLRVHDSATVADTVAPAYRPDIVLISENKDTAIHFPTVPGAVSIEGVGRGGGTLATFDWVRDADCLLYWGDMDADGLEILDGFRAAGLPVRSLFMDPDSYTRWCPLARTWTRRGSRSRAAPRQLRRT